MKIFLFVRWYFFPENYSEISFSCILSQIQRNLFHEYVKSQVLPLNVKMLILKKIFENDLH